MAAIVDILLATFNAGRFLPEQLASLEAQTHRDWRLIIRDDCSTDTTPLIIDAFAQRHNARVSILCDGSGRLGACGNFAALLEASDAPYFMFCDQDDVWLPEKISTLLNAMQEAEKRRGAATPILAHSDLTVVDNELRLVHPSFWRYGRLLDLPTQRPAIRLILRNYVTGCALIGNAALRRTALPIPPAAYMHDWWVAAVAAALGEIVDCAAPTVFYRQHLSNELGAQRRSLFGIVRQFSRDPYRATRQVGLHLKRAQQQAAGLLEMHSGELNPEILASLSDFSRLQVSCFSQRKTFLWRHRMWPDYWLSSLICWWFL